MSVKNDDTVPIICGAIYRKEMPDNSVEFATMVAVIQKNGATSGVLQRYGYSAERVKNGQASFRDWQLYAEPGLIKAPTARVNENSKSEHALA